MKLIFETCDPRTEVIHGELKDEIFAARLKDVMDGTAERVYQDPRIFFDNTYPTGGLKTLLAEALGRLTGIKPTSSSIIRLETAFGGGKTHSLIALYHVCHNRVEPDWIRKLIDPTTLPLEPIPRIAGVVGSDLDPDNGLNHGDVTTFTPWGELAYQLGGVEGYRIVERSDQQGTAPGAPTLGRLVGDEPALIMFDEVARFLRVAKGKQIGNGTLADQTIAFLMALLEMAASKSRVVVVYTLATTGDAFGKETEELQEELAEAKGVSARQERVITSTGETEMAAIVTHRLFRRID
ncbi:MAG: ATP-binding protein, partial [Candidatus Tectomicrobia bacterium]|nr:ATP-binding protein [Candidatus Tectomicrobia bacterium]